MIGVTNWKSNDVNVNGKSIYNVKTETIGAKVDLQMKEGSKIDLYSNMVENANISLIWPTHKPAAMNGAVNTFDNLGTVTVDGATIYSIKRAFMGNKFTIVDSAGTTAQYFDTLGGRTHFIGLL